MGIEVKTTGALIDELLTALIRCWHFQEIVMTSTDDAEVARAAKGAQETNARRNQLMRAIDERLGDGEVATLVKTYDHAEIKRRFDEETS